MDLNNFIENYKSHLLYILVVIVCILFLRLITIQLKKWLIKKEQQKFPDEKPRTINLVGKILNALWYILGIIAIAFIFTEKEDHELLITRFKLFSYLGFLAIATIISAAVANMWFRKTISRKEHSHEDTTNLKFLKNFVIFCIYFIGILFGLLAFPSMKSIAHTALGGAGVLALIAGVASQEALSNLVGGVFIISFKPFKIGDVIKVTDTMVGTVMDITLRHTVIKNFENKMIVIPNAIINKEKLINYDLGDAKVCEHIEIDISYDSDVALAKQLLQEECENHPFIYDNRTKLEKKDQQPKVKTALVRMNDSSVTIRAWAWSLNFPKAFEMKCDILESTKKRYETEGVEIPFPYRTLVFKNGNNQS
ncbi:Small-conductance mechanosensitive channel [Zhouia amylolytica]|uniref:Small-conductance mechanosensitive channel n=2 Tax=Zhouia amylolytica TaxID=376730 RepID=W2UPR1_9FLAO|nr:mechanosensitive ion channel family protein [Zhouia amylolytica]ETN95282.1 small-conductance mechanosensitive channel [Zhouia amylolytica AD3]MCQ0112750.1 mechanosensitive ion channel family protein [Zhouia amylolytica]SFT14752.1 Small-conductance mechanosensitive channel [Zhouia amylolytica]